jgi:hypothetical protein
MYGLEKKDKKKKFQFDLEQEIHDDPKKGRDLLKHTEHRIDELKKKLREGLDEKEFEELGIMLHAYTSAKRVLKRMLKN